MKVTVKVTVRESIVIVMVIITVSKSRVTVLHVVPVNTVSVPTVDAPSPRHSLYTYNRDNFAHAQQRPASDHLNSDNLSLPSLCLHLSIYLSVPAHLTLRTEITTANVRARASSGMI